jgi:hypothetical protein
VQKLFNNVFGPFIAFAIISSNCFRDALFHSEDVVSTYTYDSPVFYPITYNDAGFRNSDISVVIFSNTTSKNERSISYLPPFSYSYQCSSSFLEAYGGVFVMMFLLSILKPVFVGVINVMYDFFRRKVEASTVLSTLALDELKMLEKQEKENQNSKESRHNMFPVCLFMTKCACKTSSS